MRKFALMPVVLCAAMMFVGTACADDGNLKAPPPGVTAVTPVTPNTPLFTPAPTENKVAPNVVIIPESAPNTNAAEVSCGHNGCSVSTGSCSSSPCNSRASRGCRSGDNRSGLLSRLFNRSGRSSRCR